MSYHDIIVDCASISLDSIEGTAESFGRKMDLSMMSNEQNACSYESAQFVSFSSQSSCSVNFDVESVVHDTMPSGDILWTPNQATSVPSNAAISPLSIKSKNDMKNYSLQLSTEENVPLDFAVEAKPELLKMELENSYNEATSSKGPKILDISKKENSKESEDISEPLDLNVDKTVLQAIEAKEDDVDKEVSELTSDQNSSKQSSADVRHDTPFCSTTQNLTDEPGQLPLKIPLAKRSDSLLKSNEEETDEMREICPNPEMFNAPEADLVSFTHTLNRFRNFSHCGPPPVIPAEYITPAKLARSMSCPDNLCAMGTPKVPDVSEIGGNDIPAEKVVATSCVTTSAVTSTSGFVPIPSSSSSATIPSAGIVTYEDLIPMALNPLPDLKQPSSGDFNSPFLSSNFLMSSLSPPELLDRYIQSGNLASLSQLIPITEMNSTDWTHFGGTPPPDEITIVRNQVLLLHNQMLFERHRKDVHSERNRRILGRAKRFRIQEEHIVALKEQVTLLEQDNKDLLHQMDRKKKMLSQIQIEKQQIESDLLSRIAKAEQENSQLLFSNKNLQNLLVAQRKENDEIRDRCKKSQAENNSLNYQVDRASKKALQCQYIEKNSVFLSKQLILLQELISHYNEKIETLKDNQRPNIGAEIQNKAAAAEINDLKQKLDTKTLQLSIAKAKALDLEQSLHEMKNNEKRSMQMLETMKSLHHDEILIREERLEDLKRISNQKDAHILNLFKDIEILSEAKSKLEQRTNGVSSSSSHPTHPALRFAYGYNSQMSFLTDPNSEPSEDNI
ncbi:hypothetical protein JTE90_023271 [Oedothorax gibbosus]|uniref:Hamartin n=1 Tax=Oedothorax gibbosus TaxID=931172 RepID=A0AAV6U3C7_9ARAC|nr:hypothetical protein JTE90_023271 [Oedothorax gibbosus]